MTIRFVISLDAALQTLLNNLRPVSLVESKLEHILQLQEQILVKLEDFQAKIDLINANTTASAAAATAAATEATAASTASQAIKGQLDSLREQIKGMGLNEEQETQLLAQLDTAATGTEAVRTAAEGIKTANTALADFLTATAAGPTEPAPVVAMTPVMRPLADDFGTTSGTTAGN